MSDVNTGLTPNVYHEFVSAVEQLSKDALREKPEVAGLLSVGLFFAAEGVTGSTDSLGSATNGP